MCFYTRVPYLVVLFIDVGTTSNSFVGTFPALKLLDRIVPFDI